MLFSWTVIRDEPVLARYTREQRRRGVADPNESDGECASCGERVNRRAVADRLLARLIVSEVRRTSAELSAEYA